ncbi:MAG: septum formation initiator family protein [Clostridia bacterium]|jgi:septum formation initiator|nr:septum formation initiator family protein [Clostridia bacterium]CDC78643.1 septum formation initiator [Clostridium sp. CAG:465]
MKKRENINNKINKKKKIRPVMIVLFAFSIYFVYTFIEQQVQINKYDSEIEMYTADIENKRELVNYYNNQKGNTKSDEYIENVARESLGYVKPYEKIFIDANK